MTNLPEPFAHNYSFAPKFKKSAVYFSMEFAIDQALKNVFWRSRISCWLSHEKCLPTQAKFNRNRDAVEIWLLRPSKKNRQ